MLSDARQRVRRARTHLGALQRAAGRVLAAYTDKVEEHFEGGDLTSARFAELMDGPWPMPNIPPTIAILAGEVVYNLRAALDYLAVSLAELDSLNPTTRRRNQFPIESTPKGFTDRRGTFLAGISDRHVKTIERFQPYRRGKGWTADLAMLSNLDKHNRIVDVHQGIQLTLTPPEDERDADATMHAHITLPLRVGLGRRIGSPLLATLTTLTERVGGVLDAFASEFDVSGAKQRRTR